jgi:hypothetical protein
MSRLLTFEKRYCAGFCRTSVVKKMPPLPPHLKLRVFTEVNFTIWRKAEFSEDSSIPRNLFFFLIEDILYSSSLFCICCVQTMCPQYYCTVYHCTCTITASFCIYWTVNFDIIHISCMLLWLWPKKMVLGTNETLIGWKSGKTTCFPVGDRMAVDPERRNLIKTLAGRRQNRFRRLPTCG